MGQKSSPVGLRLQINRTWDSRWFAEGQDYGRLLLEDLQIRKYILSKVPQAAISKVVIERPAKICRISIYAARPGVIIGKKGADIEKLKKELGKMTNQQRTNLRKTMEIIREWWQERRNVAEPVSMPSMPASLLAQVPEAAR